MQFLYHPDTVLTAADLETLAVSLLAWLPLPGVEGDTFDPEVIWRTVMRASVGQKSTKAVTDSSLKTYSDDYTLTQLHTIPATILEEIVNDLLAQQTAMILGPRRPRIICLDFVDNRYHGHPYKELAELCSTTPRDGTTKCHRYCAAFVLARSKPLIVAVTAVRGDESRADAAERVLGRVVALPFDIACILADRGFYLEAAIRRFQETAPTIVPVVRRGERLAKALKTNISYWSEYAMYEGSERELRFPLAVCVSYQQGKRGKNGLLVRAYAACDQADRTPKQVEALYRKRSAIETSFRTFREARAKTTTRDPTVRLLFVLVGFLLRNLWLVVRWGVLAQPRRGGRELPTWFRFEVFREWIAHDLDEDLERRWEAPTNGVGIPDAYRLLDAG